MTKKCFLFGLFVFAVSLGAVGQKARVKPSQHNLFQEDGNPPDGLIFNRVLKSTSISWGQPVVSDPAGTVNIDPVANFTCVGPTTCTLSSEIKVQVGGDVTSDNVVSLCAEVDGQLMDEPEGCPFLGEVNWDGLYHVLDWTANMSKVAPGKHTIQSQIYSNYGIDLYEYNITYRLYKP